MIDTWGLIIAVAPGRGNQRGKENARRVSLEIAVVPLAYKYEAYNSHLSENHGEHLGCDDGIHVQVVIIKNNI